MDGERSSVAALRRRERRLRAWQRHVRTAVQLALAEKLHHSANKVEPDNALRGQEKRAGREEAGLETHFGLRAPTPLPRGMRMAHLSEVAGPQRCDRTNETLDSAALSFLLNCALEEKEKEEEERTKREEEQVKNQEEAEEWVALVDERTGKTFYWNDRLSATSWARPGSSSSSLLGKKKVEPLFSGSFLFGVLVLPDEHRIIGFSGR